MSVSVYSMVPVAVDAAGVRELLGLTGQFAAVDEILTGRENLQMFGRLFDLSAADARRRANELLERRYSERFTALMAFQAERAHRCYDEALALLDPVDRKTQKPGLMMANIYRALLREIEADRFQVLHQRISLTPIRKLWIAMRTNWRGR